jgi:hypothetical protein
MKLSKSLVYKILSPSKKNQLPKQNIIEKLLERADYELKVSNLIKHEVTRDR